MRLIRKRSRHKQTLGLSGKVQKIIATMPSSLQKIKDVDAKYMEAHGITEAE